MQRWRVQTPAEALDYIVDCTLATVENLCMRRSASQNELDRQMSIAQQGIDWMVQMGVKPTGRAEEVLQIGKVVDWMRSTREKYGYAGKQRGR